MSTAYGYSRPYCPAHPGGLRVAWIGDSLMHGAIYNGVGFSYRGGPRVAPYAAVRAVDPSADFIGSVLNSSESPPVTTAGTAHSGYNGSAGVNWVAPGYWDTYKSTWAGAHVICIAVGSNDANTAGAATTFSALIDNAATDFPYAVCLFATRPRIEGDDGLSAQAAQVRVEVANRRAKGKNVHLVDVYAEAGLKTGDWSDGLHLTDNGYARVGDVWARALLRLLGH